MCWMVFWDHNSFTKCVDFLSRFMCSKKGQELRSGQKIIRMSGTVGLQSVPTPQKKIAWSTRQHYLVFVSVFSVHSPALCLQGEWSLACSPSAVVFWSLSWRNRKLALVDPTAEGKESPGSLPFRVICALPENNAANKYEVLLGRFGGLVHAVKEPGPVQSSITSGSLDKIFYSKMGWWWNVGNNSCHEWMREPCQKKSKALGVFTLVTRRQNFDASKSLWSVWTDNLMLSIGHHVEFWCARQKFWCRPTTLVTCSWAASEFLTRVKSQHDAQWRASNYQSRPITHFWRGRQFLDARVTNVKTLILFAHPLQLEKWSSLFRQEFFVGKPLRNLALCQAGEDTLLCQLNVPIRRLKQMVTGFCLTSGKTPPETTALWHKNGWAASEFLTSARQI